MVFAVSTSLLGDSGEPIVLYLFRLFLLLHLLLFTVRLLLFLDSLVVVFKLLRSELIQRLRLNFHP